MNKLSRILREGGEVETLTNDTPVDSSRTLNIDYSKDIPTEQLRTIDPNYLIKHYMAKKISDPNFYRSTLYGRKVWTALSVRAPEFYKQERATFKTPEKTAAQTNAELIKASPTTQSTPQSAPTTQTVSPTASAAGAIQPEKTAEGGAAVTQALKNWASNLFSGNASQTPTQVKPATTTSTQPATPKKVAENIKFKSLSKILKEGYNK